MKRVDDDSHEAAAVDPKRPRRDDSGTPTPAAIAASAALEDDVGVTPPQVDGQQPFDEAVLQHMPIEDQIKFSGLLGTRTPPPSTGLARYRLLGNSGLRVSPLCLGTISFGTAWAAMTGKIAKTEAERIFDAYVARGGNFVDTALNYQDGESVEWLGEWMAKRGIRDQLVVACKWSLPLKHGDINAAGNHRKSLFHAVEETLRHLRTTYIDLLYLHAWDFTTPVDEIMRSVDDLVRMGKVHYVGVSDTPAWVVARANTLAELKGWTRLIAYQAKYHPAERDVDFEVLPMCRELGLGMLPWGLLSWCSRYQRELEVPAPREGESSSTAATDAAIVAIAKELGKTPAQIVLSWALQKPGVASPVLTCHSVEDLEEAIGALDVVLTPAQFSLLDRTSLPVPGYPFKYIGTSYQSSPWFKSAGTISTATH